MHTLCLSAKQEFLAGPVGRAGERRRKGSKKTDLTCMLCLAYSMSAGQPLMHRSSSVCLCFLPDSLPAIKPPSVCIAPQFVAQPVPHTSAQKLEEHLTLNNLFLLAYIILSFLLFRSGEGHFRKSLLGEMQI